MTESMSSAVPPRASAAKSKGVRKYRKRPETSRLGIGSHLSLALAGVGVAQKANGPLASGKRASAELSGHDMKSTLSMTELLKRANRLTTPSKFGLPSIAAAASALTGTATKPPGATVVSEGNVTSVPSPIEGQFFCGSIGANCSKTSLNATGWSLIFSSSMN